MLLFDIILKLQTTSCNISNSKKHSIMKIAMLPGKQCYIWNYCIEYIIIKNIYRMSSGICLTITIGVHNEAVH